ncbi:alpha/beta fold hydrolase [Roseateles albus]|uniref:Alpha/beta hydrolase n=1 Tax=Roseateles albus TaxID=2987525 RepID=A0ABT5KHL6_9BURK|nr:alpha/beta hydrolase [Roseateles albus]MDC8773029.1 alpha/beta hydrolase [Roseateles albus]
MNLLSLHTGAFACKAIILALAAPTPNAAAQTSPVREKASVVIVHGAFADGSDWAKVIPFLQAEGVRVVAVQNPLTSLEDDVAATKRAIAAQPGKVVLVGHSWGGSVITQAGTDRQVASLVYVAALAPDVGEASADLGKNYAAPAGLAHLVADAEGFLTLSPQGLSKYFAQDLTEAATRVMAATQGPIQAKSFEQKLTAAAWKDKPSWYIISENDRMIQPELQRALAKKIGAHVTSLAASHVPQQSQAANVAAVILDAVESSSR